MRHLGLLLAFALPTTALAVPGLLTQQGRLLDSSGLPLDGQHDLELELFDDPAGGASLYSETLTLDFEDGYYTALLGTGGGLDASAFAGDEAFLQLTVDTSPPLPSRIVVASVPYAFSADTATNVSGGIVDASQIRINGTTILDASSASGGTLSTLGCAAGEVPLFDGSGWGCTAWLHQHDAADLATGVLDVQRLPVGPAADQVAPGDHVHAASEVASGVLDILRIPVGTGASEVAPGDHLHVAADITGGTLDVALLPVGSGTGQIAAGDHTHPATGLDAMTGCGAGQLAKWDGTGWGCADDDFEADTDTDTQLSDAEVDAFVTNGALDLAAGSQVGGSDIATAADLDDLYGAGMCSNYTKTASPRTGNTLWANLDADWTGAGVCGSGWHVCNFQEFTVYSVLGACSPAQHWIVGGFSNVDAHRRSIWNGQDSTQCAAGNGLVTYGKWGPYHGRVHCTGRTATYPVLCCLNR